MNSPLASYEKGVHCGILKHIFDIHANYLSVRFTPPKIKKYLSQKNLQRGVLFSVFLLVIFASTTHFAHAGILGAIGDAFLGAVNILLYAILQIMSWILSAVVALFGYAVDAGNLSGPNGMLNLQATYDMWKFVRDIINIAFIFGLLFIAFAFIFQIHGYSDTKVIFKLIIAALLVNFSFPLARVLIDFANVPMYFFLQMIMGNGGSGALDNALSASRLKDILVPDLSTAIHSETSVLLLNIIFMFMFAITILVLAIQLLIRMIALVILVILSPIGFAASGIPGLKKYGSKWWDSFLNYSLFGPAAAFMLVLATNFLAAVAGGDQYNGLKQLASKTSGGDTSMIAAMGVFAIPIVMLWFTIGMAGKFSVAGASIGKDYGQKFLKGTAKKVTGYNAIKRRSDAYSKEREKRGLARSANNFGGNFGKRVNDRLDRIEGSNTGRFETQGARLARVRLDEASKEKVDKLAKEYRINERMGDSELAALHQQARKSKNIPLLAATSREMSEGRRSDVFDVTAADMNAIRDKYKNIGGVENALTEEVQNKVMAANPNAAFTDKAGNVDIDGMQDAIDKGKIKIENVNSAGITADLLVAANRESKLTEQVLAEMRKSPSKEAKLGTADAPGALKEAIEKMDASFGMGPITEDQDKQRKRIHKAFLAQTGTLHESIQDKNDLAAQAIRKDVFSRANADTLKQIRSADVVNTYGDEIVANVPVGKLVNAVAGLREERNAQGAVEAFAQQIDTIGKTSGASKKSVQVRKAIMNDHRTEDLISVDEGVATEAETKASEQAAENAKRAKNKQDRDERAKNFRQRNGKR